MKKIISLILAVIMVATLSGCVWGNGVKFAVNDDGTFIYHIVRPFEGTNKNIVNAAKTVRSAIIENLGIDDVELHDDKTENESGYEIVIGNTTREESVKTLERLKENRVNCSSDFIVKVIGKKICITAMNEEMLGIACQWFASTFCANVDSWNKLRNDYEFIYAPQIGVTPEEEGDVTVNKVADSDVGTFNLVIPEQITLVAAHGAKSIQDYYNAQGYAVELYHENEKKTDCEILVGDCSRSESKDVRAEGDNYVIKVVGKKIVVKGGNDLSTRAACDRLLDEIKKAEDGNGFNWSDGYVLNGKYEESENTYKLTFNDEFNGSAVDYSKWGKYPGYQFNSGASSLGGTRYLYRGPTDNESLKELKGYSTPIYVSDGNMVFTAQRINETDFLCTQLSTFNNMIYRYGYIEIRSKVGESPSTVSYWINGGATGNADFIKRFGVEAKREGMTEIDILENFGATHEFASNVHVWWNRVDKNGNNAGNGHTSIDGNAKYTGSSKNNKKYVHNTPLALDYHIYSCYWDEDCMQFAVDGKVYLDYQYKDNTHSSVHRLMNYFITGLNIGNPSYGWAYRKNEHKTYYEHKIDYIRIYQSEAQNSQMIKAWPEMQENGTRTVVFKNNPIALS